MKIKKAVISSSGFGTRFLPISKTIQKEMLPILNRPIIDYIVDDLVKAGIEEIIIIINEHNYQVLHFFRENKRLFNYLQKMNKTQLYQQVEHLHQKAKFSFVKQTDQDPYGTAVPVNLARQHLENEPAFLYFTGDDFVYAANENYSLAAELIQLYEEHQPGAILSCDQKPKDQLHRYGVVATEQDGEVQKITQLVEKPKPGTAPSNLVNVSKYVLTPDIFPLIDQQQPNADSGELYITDTLVELAKQHSVLVHPITETYLDGGNVKNWLKANLTMAMNDPELKQVVQEFITESHK